MGICVLQTIPLIPHTVKSYISIDGLDFTKIKSVDASFFVNRCRNFRLLEGLVRVGQNIITIAFTVSL